MPVQIVRSLLILTASITVAGTAAAQDAAPSPVSVAADAAPAKPKLLCQSVTPTGSHLSKRVCKTREQWQAENDENSRDLQSLRRGSPGQR